MTPDRLGRYRVVGILGRGGMGVVYHAHDDQLDRPIAIKVVGEANATAVERERLQREARSAARIRRQPTYYQLGDLARSQKTMGPGTAYLDALILFEQGRRPKRCG